MSMIAHSSPRRFSIGVPVIATRRRAREPAQRTRALRRRVLDVLRLVEQQPVPARSRASVSMSRVAMSYDVTTTSDGARRSTSAVAGQPVAAVMRGARAATARSARSRATHCRATLIGQTTSVGPNASAPNSSRSEASIAIACTVLPRPMSSARIAPIPRSPSMPQPAVAALLEREELNWSSPPASASGWKRRSSPLEQLASGVVERRPRRARARPRRSRGPRPRARGRRPRRRCAGARGSGARARPPSAAARASGRATRTNGSFAAASSISSSSRRASTSPTASRQSNRASASVESSPLERTSGRTLVAVRLTRRRLDELHPVARQQHRHAELLEPRDRRAEHEPDVVVGAARSGRLGRVEARGRPRRGPARSGRAARCDRDPRVGASGGSRRPRRRRRGAATSGGPSVGSSAACSQSSSTTEDDRRRRPRAARRGALVETQAEQPGRARAALEAAVDPVGEPALERAEAGVGRQLRLGRREPVEEELGSARPGAHEPVARAGRRRREAGRARSGRRRTRRDRGRARRDRRRTRRRRPSGSAAAIASSASWMGSSMRRAPVGEPGAAAVLELRVEEPLRDRAARRARGRRTSLGPTRRARGRAASRPAARSAP